DGQEVSFQFDAGTSQYFTTCEYEEVLDIIMEDWEDGELNTFPWVMDGDADWFSTSVNPYEGILCMQSGAIGDGDQTILKMTLDFETAGEVSFACRTSSESGWDFLTFKIDGNTLGEWSGETPWTEVAYPITAGTHTLRFTYDKDAFCCVEGEDAVWVDNITFPPYTVVSVEETTLSRSSLNLFPNPAGDIIQISLPKTFTGIQQFEITDITGRKVQSGQLSSTDEANMYTINVGHFSPGQYVLMVSSELEFTTATFIKK
ncbi:MAG: hypothetical protein RL220_1263, partial [Bacteroidota bacterium]